MKKTLLTVILCFSFMAIFGQTKIITTSGNTIDCRYIKNKRFGVQYISLTSSDSTTDYIPHSKIDRIEYENGDVEYISGVPKKEGKGKKDPKDFNYLSQSYVSINAGVAVPIPDWDFYSGYTGSTGGAITGPFTCIDAVYNPDVLDGFGISGLVGYSYNPFSNGPFVSTLQTQLPYNASNVNITTVGWHNIYFMGGVNYFLETSNRWMFDAKVMLGGIYSFHPSAIADYDTSGIHTTTKLESERLFFCLGAQVSARYFLTRKLSLKGSINVMISSGGFNELTRTDFRNSTQVFQSVVSGPTDGYIQWMGVTVGVAYTLGK